MMMVMKRMKREFPLSPAEFKEKVDKFRTHRNPHQWKPEEVELDYIV